jgi:Ca-activated chloride channel family protein
VYFAATAIFPRGNPRDIEALDIKITGPGGADCYRSERELSTRAKTDGGALTTVLSWNGTVPGSSKTAGCSVPGKYVFKVTRDAKDGTDRVPLELQLRIEPPVTGSLGEPAQTGLVDFAQQPSGAVQPVRGGGSFNEATTLPGAGRYGETIYNGEELFYRVNLDWGQGLAYRVTYGGRPGAATTNIRTGLFSPVRSDIKYDTTAYLGSTTTLPSNGKPIATPRIAYLNRNAADAALRKSSVDGWYYLVVKVGSALGDEPAGGVPVTIDLAVAGDKVAGPEYGASTGGAVGTPTPTTSTPSAGSTPSGSGTTAAQNPGGDTKPAADETSSALPWIILGAVLLLLLVVAIVVVLIVRRRRPPAPPTYPNVPGQGWTNRP